MNKECSSLVMTPVYAIHGCYPLSRCVPIGVVAPQRERADTCCCVCRGGCAVLSSTPGARELAPHVAELRHLARELWCPGAATPQAHVIGGVDPQLPRSHVRREGLKVGRVGRAILSHDARQDVAHACASNRSIRGKHGVPPPAVLVELCDEPLVVRAGRPQHAVRCVAKGHVDRRVHLIGGVKDAPSVRVEGVGVGPVMHPIVGEADLSRQCRRVARCVGKGHELLECPVCVQLDRRVLPRKISALGVVEGLVSNPPHTA
mmetsp:Transcript_19425/g.55964  ORF Transcript_19425/g.55964 Transcript_19425/m.55964 type:complete len:261 (-) Transcript_19425:243-1025(-)